jgi:hypothetical protein
MEGVRSLGDALEGIMKGHEGFGLRYLVTETESYHNELG